MNTKHTRVVVTLFLAVAALATMGFSAAYEDNRVASILPDVGTCEAVPVSFTAVELLSFLDEACIAGLLDEVEMEIDKGLAAPSAGTLIDDILARSRAVAASPVDLLEESETGVFATELDLGTGSSSSGKALVESVLGHSVDAAPGPVPFGLYELRVIDVTEIELDMGINSAPSGRALVESILGRSIAGPSDLLEESEVADNSGSTVELSAYPFAVDLYELSATDVAEMELDQGLGSVPSGRALVESILGRSISTYPSADLFE